MLRALKTRWKKLPPQYQQRVYRILKTTGLPYCLSYLADFKELHNAAYFAGNLLWITEAYARSSGADREALTRAFLGIADHLVLTNGVRKTTYAQRQQAALATLLGSPEFRIPSETIRVLDIPSSIGIACLDSLEALERQYRVSAYVMADLYSFVQYDQARECVFDESGNLLQVRRGNRFFSVNRPHRSGDVYGLLARVAFAPLDLLAWYLRRSYRFDPARDVTRLLLVHPEVEARCGDGVLSLKSLDVFQPIDGEYDLILSFNLLQKNYFPPSQIAMGVDNLRHALRENGLLVIGDSEHFAVSRKSKGQLAEVYRSGEF